MMFRGKQRPHDLVFPCCEPCNSKTRISDLVASLLSRTYSDHPTAIDEADLQKVLRAVGDNVPGLLQEMLLSDAKQLRAQRTMPKTISDRGWALRADGPILTSHILTFGAKLGLALHFELHQRPVPTGGGVQPIWFSNVQAAKGEIPDDLLAMLPAARTLTQGKQNVGDQFQYSWATTEDREHTLLYAVFRQSFAMAAITANDRSLFLSKWADKHPVFAPGEIKDPSPHLPTNAP
jgi:hypothetical protein